MMPRKVELFTEGGGHARVQDVVVQKNENLTRIAKAIVMDPF